MSTSTVTLALAEAGRERQLHYRFGWADTALVVLADEIVRLRAALADAARPEASPYWVPRTFHDAMLEQARAYTEAHK